MNSRKRNALALVLALATAAPEVLAGQEKPQPPKTSEETAAPADRSNWVQKIFEIRYADVRQLHRLLVNFASITFDPELKVLAVSGRPETVAAVEDAIKRLDVPRVVKNIELMAYVLVASEKAAQGSEAPAELEGVIRQLKGIFPYQSYRVMDTLMLRVRDGEAGRLSGTFPAASEALSRPYIFNFRSASLTPDDTPPVVRIQDLSLVTLAPAEPRPPAGREGKDEKKETESARGANINTNLDIREGQKVVVGRSNLDGRTALVLVLSARVLE